MDEKMDIDRMLVVTFTNAAASEMRERILEAIYKKIEEKPNDSHLQRQIVLLNKASICTIHSFCLEVIRNYFYELEISANFQIGDSSEMELLKQETLEELFEEKYIQKEEDFLMLVDTYATYRGDETLKELILRIDNQIQSSPFPKEWLEEKINMFDLQEKLEQDFSKTIWGKLILQELEEEIVENRLKLEKIAQNLRKYPELEKYVLTILQDKEQLEKIENAIRQKENAWDKTYQLAKELTFEKWPVDRKVTIEYKNEAKEMRDKIKKSINTVLEKTMLYPSKEANETMNELYPLLKRIQKIVLEFEEKFASKKKEKNRIDFHDIEHFALKLLIQKDEKGQVMPSNIAKQLQEKYDEIAIDEYQDSNLVQEYILNSVSKQNNIFMVGDIKQSIYRFREARPELFLEKYRNYEEVSKLSQEGNGRKIKLFKNFRSREEVLNLTNWVFQQIMSEKLGDVEYNEEEYLNLGADYQKENDRLPELHILDLAKEENELESQEEEIEEEKETEIIEKNVEEAKMVVKLIQELFEKNVMVYDKKQGKRKIQYKDIAILLRSTANVAPIYEKELTASNIPVFCDSSSEYLETTEIQTIMALLKIMDNPMQDIPLVHVLRSPIGNFTDNDLVEIRLSDAKGYFYEAMLKKRITAEEELRAKIDRFLTQIETWRQEEKELPLNELIWKIYMDTNYYHYVGLLNNGDIKQANLKMLFERAKQYEKASFKGLYHFIHFVDRLRQKNNDLSSAKMVGENDNVIRIMSIHKSKGLEFPVVFLCNAGKQFNKQDLNDSILIHQELGFGPKYKNRSLAIEYPTLAKEAIKLQLEKELISEEMRVLYVALTRAKEKLIITGNSKDWNKSCKEKQEMLSLYEQKGQEKLQERLVKKYHSYLDWLTLLLQQEGKQNNIKVVIHKKQEREKQEEVVAETKEEKRKIEKEEIEKIRQELEWKYPYQISSQIPTKTSVSKLKEKWQEETRQIEWQELVQNKQEYHLQEPEFAKRKQEKISSARRGTLIHLCMQKLEEKKEYSKEELKNLVESLVQKEIILAEEAKEIPISVLENYQQSNLWKDLKTAKEIHKEEPFYLQIPANRMKKEYPPEDKILVQGIMDLYYINQKDELILVDYKTNYIEKGQESKLVEKYQEQLELYQEALEKALNRKVDKVMIYSTWVGEIER